MSRKKMRYGLAPLKFDLDKRKVDLYTRYNDKTITMSLLSIFKK